MKLSRKLIPAFAMLLVSAIMLTTASFAWFSINTSVTAEGMSVKTTAADNVLIASTTLGSTTAEGEADFVTDLDESATLADKVVHPVSSIDGQNFFYTAGTNVKGDGDAKTDAYTKYTPTLVANGEYAGQYLDSAFNTAYGTENAVGYVDYVFQIKATNTKDAAKALNLTDLTLTYSGENTGWKAFRVAMFVEVGTLVDEEVTFSGTLGELKTILAPAGADNYTTGKAVSSTSGLSDVTYGSDAALGTVNAKTTTYFKVVVRLWLEGEDTTCNNDVFFDLAEGSFALNLVVELEGTVTNELAVASTTP